MKIIINKKISTNILFRGLLIFLSVFMAIVIPMQIIGDKVSANRASEILEQIEALNQDIAAYQAESARLNSEAATLQSAIAKLVNERAIIQAQIDINQAKYDQFVMQIADTEKKIKDNQDGLGRTIANLYVDDQVTPLEMIASSNNISEYMDKQEYRNSVRDELVASINSIKELKVSLNNQKDEVDKILGDQKNARQSLSDKENQQQALLDSTNGQESVYQQLLVDSQSEKNSLEEEYRNLGRTTGEGISDPTKGNYPWGGDGCYVAFAFEYDVWSIYSYNGINGDGTDALGYACRQCTSYVAWRILDKTKKSYAYWGDAKHWPVSARNNNIPTGTVARANSAGVMTDGDWGHVVWVESNPDSQGRIVISQFNSYNDNTGDDTGVGWGNYSKKLVDASDYDEFIYF